MGLPIFVINKIHDIILSDLKVKVHEIAKIVSISMSVWLIFCIHICMIRFCARWVPRLLATDQERIRVTNLERNLAYFKHNPKRFLHRFLTINVTWIHHHTLKSREGSKQGVKTGESAPVRRKMQQ